jgi:hypothetical protein
MRIRTIAAALVVAAPLLALGSPQAAACWGTGYGYTATGAATPVAPRRYGYMSYGYSSPTYYGGYGGYYGGIGLGVGRVAVRRAVYRGSGYYGGVRRVGYRGGIGVGRVGVGRVGVGRIGRR